MSVNVCTDHATVHTCTLVFAHPFSATPTQHAQGTSRWLLASAPSAQCCYSRFGFAEHLRTRDRAPIACTNQRPPAAANKPAVHSHHCSTSGAGHTAVAVSLHAGAVVSAAAVYLQTVSVMSFTRVSQAVHAPHAQMHASRLNKRPNPQAQVQRRYGARTTQPPPSSQACASERAAWLCARTFHTDRLEHTACREGTATCAALPTAQHQLPTRQEVRKDRRTSRVSTAAHVHSARSSIVHTTAALRAVVGAACAAAWVATATAFTTTRHAATCRCCCSRHAALCELLRTWTAVPPRSRPQPCTLACSCCHP